MYKRNQLIIAQQKYNQAYLDNPEDFAPEVKSDLDTAIEQIDYLLSLIKSN